MRDIMIDIETLATAHNAKMLSIGAVRFDPFNFTSFEELKKDAFYMNVAVESYDEPNMAGAFVESASTLKWWSEQSEAAIAALEVNPHPVRSVLGHLVSWMDSERHNEVWANGPDFDLRIIATHLDFFGMKTPWIYREQRDYRTTAANIKRFTGFSPTYPDMTAHNALDDAAAQAMAVQQIFSAMKPLANRR